MLKSRDSKGVFSKKIGDDSKRCHMIKEVVGSKEGGVFFSFLFVSKQNHLNMILSEQDQSMVFKLQQTLESPE